MAIVAPYIILASGTASAGRVKAPPVDRNLHQKNSDSDPPVLHAPASQRRCHDWFLPAHVPITWRGGEQACLLEYDPGPRRVLERYRAAVCGPDPVDCLGCAYCMHCLSCFGATLLHFC